MKRNRILSYCHLTNVEVNVNGKLLEIHSGDDVKSWFSNIYNYIGSAYPKFFKMDRLCKAGLLASDLVMRESGFFSEEVKENGAVVCFNSAGSLDDDAIYQQTIQQPDEYFPSPAVFVYTLANIVAGEMCIRHKIMGESSFYISQNFPVGQFVAEVEERLAEEGTDFVLGGWVDFDNGKSDVFLMLVVSSDHEGISEFSEDILIGLLEKR